MWVTHVRPVATQALRSAGLTRLLERFPGNLDPGVSLALKRRVLGGTPMRIANYVAAAAATIVLGTAPAAMAQTAGSTSGPAAGSTVAPNTAVQKENPANP